MTYLININEQKVRQNEEREGQVLNLKKGETSEKELSEMKISNLSDKELKVTAIKILNSLQRKVDELSEIFNKETKKNQSELNNIITRIKKDTLEQIKSRLDDAEE